MKDATDQQVWCDGIRRDGSDMSRGAPRGRGERRQSGAGARQEGAATTNVCVRACACVRETESVRGRPLCIMVRSAQSSQSCWSSAIHCYGCCSIAMDSCSGRHLMRIQSPTRLAPTVLLVAYRQFSPSRTTVVSHSFRNFSSNKSLSVFPPSL